MAIIDRTKAEALIREQVVAEIVQKTPENSVFMSLAKRLPNMTSKQTRIRVLDFMPLAYWVNGDTGFKQTSEQAWDNVYLEAEELAVIVPIPEAVLADADIDIMGEVLPRINEAFGLKVDDASIFGKNKPASWPLSIVDRARQAGNNVDTSADTDYFEALFDEGGAFNKVEQYGNMVNGCIASMGMRAKLRGLRDQVGNPIFKTDMQGTTQYALDGAPLYFPKNGSFDTSKAQIVVGDWSQAVYSIRQDVTVKILTEGVVQDPSDGSIVYNLAQQDMVALRVVFRMGWALPNPVSGLDSERLGCPFAYLEPNTPYTTYTDTITVQDSSSVAISGAYVEINGARKKTDASGQVVFNLTNGTYNIKVKKSGYNTAESSVTINGSNTTGTITLTE